MTTSLKFAVLLLLTSFKESDSSQGKSVCIAPYDQSLPPFCAVTTNFNQLCGNTEDYFNTLITVLEGTHTLNVACEFKEITNLTLRGNTNGTTISCSSKESGLRFLNVTHLEISDIEFKSCGCTGYAVSNLYGLLPNILSALLFINGSSLTLTNVTVVNAVSAGIYIYNVVDYVTMDSCKVIDASSNRLERLCGTILAYDDTIAMFTTFLISQCHFNNSGYTKFRGTCSFKKTISFSSGLTLFHGNPNLTVTIIDTALSGNTGCNGGNMALLFFDIRYTDYMPMVSITRTNFTSGKSHIGGGFYLSFENSFADRKYNRSYPDHTCTKALSLVNSVFYDNFATFNGGGIFIQWKQSLILDRIVDMEIKESTFESNSIGGSGGLALNYKTFIEIGNEAYILAHFRVNLNISRCFFHNHVSKDKLSSENSVIQARLVPYLGIHDTNITSNDCTAILAIGTTLVFYGSSRISNNTAFMGAGLRLCSNSLMYLTPYVELVITNNSVQQTGGGILVSSSCLVDLPMCFYQFSRDVTKSPSLLETINVTINDNNAPKGENNIFGGSIDYCYLLYVRQTDKHFKYFLRVPNNSISSPSSISSAPQQICFHNSSDTEYNCEKERYEEIYPGQDLACTARVVGQLKGAVPGTIWASIREGGNIDETKRFLTVNISGGNLTYTVYSSQSEIIPGKKIKLKLEASVNSDESTNEYVLRRYKPAVIRIKFKNCPFGFMINNVSSTDLPLFSCQCIKDSAIQNCSIADETITKTASSWIGMYVIDNQTLFATSLHCPLDYCDPNVSSVHSEPDCLDQDKQCQYNRTGVLCGSCPENWSLVLGSSECRDNCSNVYLLLILPFAVAGFLLVLIIHFLNLTVTMGTVCGLIFYANIVQDYSIVLLSEHPIPGLTPILQVFLAWLNLDLGIQTCFYEGMEAFGKTMFLYVFPIYIWLISAVIIFLSNRYICVTRLVGENAVKVLATLFLLSYSKMLRVTLGSLNFKSLRIANITSNVTKHMIEHRWILDGNIAYFDGRSHLWLFLISLFFIIFTLPFSFSLLCLKFVHSLSNYCRVFSWIDKLKPFFDTYTGPYKDKARFWTGLLLLVRIFLLVVHAVDFSDITLLYRIVMTICFVLISIMVTLNGVYKYHYLNVLEYFFICNIELLFFTLLSVHGAWQQSIACHLLVSLALLAFLGIVGYHVYFFLYKQWGIPNFWHRNTDLVTSCEGMRGYDRLESEDDDLRPIIG